MLRVALLADRLGHEELTLLRGLRRHEFHVVTLDRSSPVSLPGNVMSHTSLPALLPSPATSWRTVEAAARQVCRSYLAADGAGRPSSSVPTDHRLFTAGVRLLSHLAATTSPVINQTGPHPSTEVLQPTFGPHPLAGLRLDALGPESLTTATADSLVATLRPLTLRLPPVHVVHAIGAASGLAALAHSWRRGTPYVLSSPESDDPLAQLCRHRAHQVVTLSPALDPGDYPPRLLEPQPPTVLTVNASTRPLGADFFASSSVAVVTGGVSYPLVEAMLSGLAVVAIEADGVAELVGDTGMVVSAGSGAVHTACEKLIGDPELRWDLGLRARKRALERHSLSPWLAAHEMHYAAAAGA